MVTFHQALSGEEPQLRAAPSSDRGTWRNAARHSHDREGQEEDGVGDEMSNAVVWVERPRQMDRRQRERQSHDQPRQRRGQVGAALEQGAQPARLARTACSAIGMASRVVRIAALIPRRSVAHVVCSRSAFTRGGPPWLSSTRAYRGEC